MGRGAGPGVRPGPAAGRAIRESGMATLGHAVDTAAERRMLLLGVRLFILSEVMLFGAFFTAYFVLRAQAPSWPPLPDLERPELPLVGFNTLLLLSSSVTMQWAEIGRASCRERV